MGADAKNWRWDKVHSNYYPSMPWSRTPLKFIFDREVPVAGNSMTPNVSKVSYRKALEEGKFTSNHVAGLKMVVAHSPKGPK